MTTGWITEKIIALIIDQTIAQIIGLTIESTTASNFGNRRHNAKERDEVSL